MRYIQDKLKHGILFARELNQGDEDLIGYLDSNWCGNKSDKKSPIDYTFKFMKIINKIELKILREIKIFNGCGPRKHYMRYFARA